MSIKRTIITTVLALAMVALVAPVTTQAVTVDELMAQIATLQSQLQGLSGTTTVTAGTGACAGVTFTRNLTVGSTGSDVKCLQVLLNANGYKLATTGAGSPGMETSYFGPRTLAVVKAFQVAKGWTPANQVGPLTRAAFNALLGTTGGTTTTLPAGCTSTSGFSPTTGASCATGVVVVVPTGAGLSVMASSDNPNGGGVVAGQAQAQMLKLVFTNGDNAPVKVTTLKLNRGGISSDALLTNVYLFDGVTRLTDAASVSAGVIGFNDSTGLFTVPAYGSKTITVEADINSDSATYSGQVVSINLASATNVTTNASSVKGNYPILGNMMSVVSGTTLATAYFSTIYGTDAVSDVYPSGATIDPQSDYPVWYTNLNVNISTGTVNMTRISLGEVGSINYSDVQNFRLYVDGVQVGSAVPSLDANGYATFNLTSSPAVLKSGARQIKVLADIIGGSSRNFSFQLKTSADITLVDGQYGVNIVPTISTTATTVTFASLRSCYTLSTTTYGCTINSGATTTSKTTDSPSGNVINTASSQTLARWTLKANGERVKVDTLKAYVKFTNVAGTTTVTNDCADSVQCTDVTKMTLRNAALYANGVQIGNTASLTPAATGTTFNLGSSLIVDPLTPVTLELKADIYDNTGTFNDIDATDTLQAYLIIGSGNGMGQVSSTSVNVPTATVAGNQLTVAAGGLTLSNYNAYTNQTTVAPLTNYKLGHFTLTAGTTEAVNISTVEVDLIRLATYTSNLYVKLGSFTTAVKSAPSATSTWSVNYSLPAGTTVDVMVYGDVASSKTGSTTGSTGVSVSGTTAQSSTSASAVSGGSTGVLTGGQTITFGTGSINAVVDGTTPQSTAVAGGQQVSAGKFKFTAQNDSYTVTELRFTAKDANATANGNIIQSASLMDGTTTLGTTSYDSVHNYFYFTGLTLPVAANTTKTLTVSLLLGTPYTDGVTVSTGENAIITLSYMKALNGSGVSYDAGTGAANTDSSVHIAGATGGTSAANYLYVYKSVPTFTVGTVASSSAALSSGAATSLYSFTVAAGAKGPVSLKQLKFYVAINDNVGAAGSNHLGVFRLFRGSTDLVNQGLVTIVDNTDVTHVLTAALGATTSITTSGTADVIFNTEEVIPAGQSYTYTLKATGSGFSCASGTCDSVSTSLPQTQATAPTGTTAGYNATYYYLGSAANSSTAIQGLNTTAGAGAGTAANIIWSDNSGKSHDYVSTSSGSADWFGGYLIQNLPLDSIGVSAQ